MRHRFIWMLVTALIVVAHGARADLKDDLVGTWEYKHPPTGFVLSMTLGADGSGVMDDEPMKWSAAGDTLTVVQDGETQRYTIRLDGNSLHASGGDLDEPITFTRKGAAAAAAAAERKGGLGGKLQEVQQQERAKEPAGPRGSGTWVCNVHGTAFTLELKPDGSGAFNATPLKWTLAGDALRLDMGGGVVAYEAQLTDDRLTLRGGDLPQALAFQRKPARADQADNQHDAGEPSVVGRWNSQDGPVELKPDGTGTINGTPVRYKLEPGVVVIFSEEEGVTRIPYKLDADGNRMTVLVDGEQGVLTRVGAGGGAGQAPGGAADAAADAPPGAGVYVAYESSVDPNFMMSYTQYVILWPDGTVGYAKAEGGATRAQVTDSLERFTSFKTNPQVKGQTVGTWESDGTHVVVRWNLWNNLVCRGQFNGGALHLEKMGVIDEGATLKFEKQ
jgi:hypothetical protein